MIGYADTCYLSDLYKTRSQTGYVFTCEGTVISWWVGVHKSRYFTFSNHAEVIALHEASRECVWQMSVTQHIQLICGLSIDRVPTVLF